MTEAPKDLAKATRVQLTQMLGDPALRPRAEEDANEMLRDLIGNEYSDTTLRVATDHILSFTRNAIRNGPSIDAARDATGRLIDIASSDTHQARRVADFLMAWWNGPDLGKFDIADLFALDRPIAADIATIIAFLGHQGSAIYPDQLGYRAAVQDIIARWRNLEAPPA